MVGDLIIVVCIGLVFKQVVVKLIQQLRIAVPDHVVELFERNPTLVLASKDVIFPALQYLHFLLDFAQKFDQRSTLVFQTFLFC